MLIKPFLRVSALGFTTLMITAISLAGGVETAPAPAPEPIVKQSGFYLEADAGYDVANWNRLIFDQLTTFTTSRTGSGGFTVGGDFGYKWNEYLGTEIGAFLLPRLQGQIFNAQIVGPRQTFVVNGKFRVDNWFSYAAIKLIGPLRFLDNLDVFFKAGAAYRSNELSSPLTVNDITTRTTLTPTEHDDSYFAAPLFALGAEYEYHNWLFNIQWMYVGARERFLNIERFHIFNATVSANMFTVGVGYHFAV